MESGFRSSFPKKSDEVSLRRKEIGTWLMVAIAAEIGLNLAMIA